ncbi:MAG: hypothetical protein QOI81_1183 [Actinomycetota bacterium]|nr:hypothetical protein [Actinomycetota bacterium]
MGHLIDVPGGRRDRLPGPMTSGDDARPRRRRCPTHAQVRASDGGGVEQKERRTRPRPEPEPQGSPRLASGP